MQYWCNVGCCGCGHYWVTRKRNTIKPPARCPKCNCSKIIVFGYSIADEEQPINLYEKTRERMFKEFMKSQGDV